MKRKAWLRPRCQAISHLFAGDRAARGGFPGGRSRPVDKSNCCVRIPSSKYLTNPARPISRPSAPCERLSNSGRIAGFQSTVPATDCRDRTSIRPQWRRHRWISRNPRFARQNPSPSRRTSRRATMVGLQSPRMIRWSSCATSARAISTPSIGNCPNPRLDRLPRARNTQ